jgi:peptide chain release factor 2
LTTSATDSAPSGAIFDLASAKRALDEVEREMSAPGFWDNPENAQEVGRKRARVEKRIETGTSIESKSEELDVLLDLQKEGESVDSDIETLVDQLEREINSIELTMKLSGEHDLRDCIVSIHPGAGGTESQDWAEMLLRMYLRYCERKGWSTEMLEYQAGEEAGLKSATFMTRGDYAYGYLKAETGVHRLVRISRECIGSSASRRTTRPSGGTPRSHRCWSIPTSMTRSTSRSTTRICASTRIGHRAPADSTSMSPIRQSASPTCQVASW